MTVKIFKSLTLSLLMVSTLPLVAQKKEIKKSDQKDVKTTEKKTTHTVQVHFRHFHSDQLVRQSHQDVFQTLQSILTIIVNIMWHLLQEVSGKQPIEG